MLDAPLKLVLQSGNKHKEQEGETAAQTAAPGEPLEAANYQLLLLAEKNPHCASLAPTLMETAAPNHHTYQTQF